jgi:hypothetical protein
VEHTPEPANDLSLEPLGDPPHLSRGAASALLRILLKAAAKDDATGIPVSADGGSYPQVYPDSA